MAPLNLRLPNQAVSMDRHLCIPPGPDCGYLVCGQRCRFDLRHSFLAHDQDKGWTASHYSLGPTLPRNQLRLPGGLAASGSRKSRLVSQIDWTLMYITFSSPRIICAIPGEATKTRKSSCCCDNHSKLMLWLANPFHRTIFATNSLQYRPDAQ